MDRRTWIHLDETHPRRSTSMTSTLRLPALATEQSPGKILYQFAVDGKQLDRFAAVSRIHRNSEQRVQGYQRPEARKHIRAIQKYIESESPMIPNGIVIAFDARVTFEPADAATGHVGFGYLAIPLDQSDLPGWIVDGQQRTAAVREAEVPEFNILATAFITDSAAEQREQFILVNSTKPLPKSLIHELLPGTDTLLPPALARRKISTALLEELNRDPASPFHWRIQTPTNPDGVIKDNSVLKMLDNSITDGYLYMYRDPIDGSGDLSAMAEVVNAYWSAVQRVFPAEWYSVPRRSRLVHGAGIVAMGYLMDAIADRLHPDGTSDTERYEIELRRISGDCRWMRGEWHLPNGERRQWNHFQNIGRDIQTLADQILALYRGSIDNE